MRCDCGGRSSTVLRVEPVGTRRKKCTAVCSLKSATSWCHTPIMVVSEDRAGRLGLLERRVSVVWMESKTKNVGRMVFFAPSAVKQSPVPALNLRAHPLTQHSSICIGSQKRRVKQTQVSRTDRVSTHQQQNNTTDLDDVGTSGSLRERDLLVLPRLGGAVEIFVRDRLAVERPAPDSRHSAGPQDLYLSLLLPKPLTQGVFSFPPCSCHQCVKLCASLGGGDLR